MSTIAKIRGSESSHWYHRDGRACYQVERSDGQGMRPTTLRDARKLNLLPSVTTVLRVLHKQGLVDWMIEQACLSVLTAPRPDTEELDAFVRRVLHTERQQDAEAQKARDLGTDIHNALEAAVQGKQCDDELRVYVDPVLKAIDTMGGLFGAEQIVVGEGYAGKTDLILANGDWQIIVDFKTTKKLPKEAYPEHRLQLAAYAAAWRKNGHYDIGTYNIYISTEEAGKIVTCPSGTMEDFLDGFAPLLKTWQWLNNYNPQPEG